MIALIGAVLPRLLDKGVIHLLANEAKKRQIADTLAQMGTDYLLTGNDRFSHMASKIVLYINSTERQVIPLLA